MIPLAAFALGLAAVAAPQPATADTGTFTLVRGGTVIGAEVVERDPDALRAELSLRDQGFVVVRAELNDDATVRRMEVRSYPLGASLDEDPIQSSAAEFRGDTLILEHPVGTPIEGGRVPVEPGTIPYLEPSPSLIEQIILRARAIGGADVHVPVWSPGPDGGTTATALVSFRDDACTVELSGLFILIAVDPEGRLVSASIPTLDLTIWRL